MHFQFIANMESGHHPARAEIGDPQLVIQQYARYSPALESTLRSASSLGSARSQLDVSKSPPLQRRRTPRSLQSSPSGVRSVVQPSSFARPGTSMSPPTFDGPHQSQAKDAIDQAESRTLPSREVSDETIDDAYVIFILYCNPNVPSSVDTSELRRTFRCPPRSDGKSFSIFTLLELIRKLDNKELKTWIQLAIELGVEPPSMEKKQSTQKVQQYAVRLKRWMRAMHVDAFFEFCMGHPHAYYTDLPLSGPSVGDSRDGVPLEEDLALRALMPQWKPKRGRKRGDGRELDDEKDSKRPHLDTSVNSLHHHDFQSHSITFPQSAIPFSAFPEELESNDPWMRAPSFPTGNGSVSATGQQGQDLRWRFPDRDPSPTGYPRSAITPRRNQQSDVHISAEPRSAITPSSGQKSRSTRRHGPAVSSAWPRGSGSSFGKTRGRPTHKASPSGSFSTFQVHPPRESPQNSHARSLSSPVVLDQSPSNPATNISYNNSPIPVTNARPGKLQLQVPQHAGGPVRLATPPALSVNGAIISQAGGSDGPHHRDTTGNGMARVVGTGPSTTLNGYDHEHVKIPVDEIIGTLSGELHRAPISGRSNRLSHDEARHLASAVVMHLSKLYSQFPIQGFSDLMVLHLGLGTRFGLTDIPPGSMMVKVGARFSDSAENAAISDGNFSNRGEVLYTVSYEYKQSCRFSMRIILGDTEAGSADAGLSYDAVIAPKQKGDPFTTEFDIEDDSFDEPASETTWRQRYLRLRAQMQRNERALSRYKRKIVESVMADI